MPAPSQADMESQFTIENGTVGGRLHLLTVPPEGAIEEELIDPEQYVGEVPLHQGNFAKFTASPGREGGGPS